MAQDSPRLGAIELPGIAFATASCIAYISMKGVMRPGVSAGSNQVGASEMCAPMVSVPSEAASIGPACIGPAAPNIVVAESPRTPRRVVARLIGAFPCWCAGWYIAERTLRVIRQASGEGPHRAHYRGVRRSARAPIPRPAVLAH